ncbi:MAG: DUF2778 domain-containing protein [Pseudolabrys sp.]|nr:DUF2778 domain-containing protein [Pseudolabrys sp.]
MSAVAAAAIYLPLPQGRSVLAPELRSSFALPTPDVDFVETWRERAQLAALSPRAGQDIAWMPEGGLSTLQATRFPNAGRVRFDVAARLPLPRPDVENQDIAQQDNAHQDVARQGVVRTTPVVAEPQLASLPPQPKSEPGIFDKLFADPDRAAKAVLAANPNTALYDIAKRVVYLPDGDRLEAHSGYGRFMDDPQSIERKDVGVTPPNVYAVSFREKPFHGVRALRMKPVGVANMYGRDGILAHSYLLGEAGASNGCISVRDYDKFVKAYEDGKFNQIIVLRSADEPVPAQVASNQADGT